MTLLTELCNRSALTLFRIFSPYPFVQPPPAWPNVPGRSNYGILRRGGQRFSRQDGCGEVLVQQIAWAKRTSPSCRSPKVREPRLGRLLQHHNDHFHLAKMKESLGQVTFTRFGQAETKIFRQSRDKEIKSLLESGASRALSIFGGEQAFSEGAPGSCADFSLRGPLEAH